MIMKNLIINSEHTVKRVSGNSETCLHIIAGWIRSSLYVIQRIELIKGEQL